MNEYIKGQHDWYGVSLKQVVLHGGGTLLARYNNSLIRALQSLYPNYAEHYSNTVKRKYNVTKTQRVILQHIQRVSSRE